MSNFLDQYIMKILLEAERSRGRGLGRGRYKSEIDAQPGALARSNPKELLRRLGVSKISQLEDIDMLKDFVDQVTSGDDAMSEAYSDYEVAKDDANGLEGIIIKINGISARDAARYMKHAVVAGELAEYTNYRRSPFVELLEGANKIILYFGDEAGMWGKEKKRGAPPKKTPPVTQKNKK